MQVCSTVEKDAQLNRTAQRIREIVLSRFSFYIRVCGEKNDETCRTHAKKYLHCWLCNVFIWKKDFYALIIMNKILLVVHWCYWLFGHGLNILFTKMNARSRKRIFFWCYWVYNARKWSCFDEFEFRNTLMKVLKLNWMFTILQISLWRVRFVQLNADWRKWTYFRIIVWLLVQTIAYFL